MEVIWELLIPISNYRAKNEGLDLIEIAPNANPPVCKIMDMGKYKYDAQKRILQKKNRR